MPPESPSRSPLGAGLTRREAIATGVAAAGLAMLNDVFAAENNPGEIVADRASSIRITKLTARWVGSNIFVKIDTSAGVSGWGDLKAVDLRVAKPLVESLYELLDGENPTRIEHLWQKLYRSHRDIRGGAFMVHSIAAIDMALWDIAGKLHGVPVYRLLGGPVRDKIRVYHTPKAVKIPPPKLFEHASTPAEVQMVVNSIRAAREKVGMDGAVMFDAHCMLPPATLIQVAAAIEPYNLLFIEEPAVPDNIEVFKRLKQQIKIPLASGERDRTIWGMIPYLQERCLDILQPDCCHTGGISQVRKIATLAEAFNVPLAPHCTASNLGIAASMHAIAAVPNFLIHEFYPDNGGFNPKRIARVDWQVDKDGYAALPPGPGLGVEIDEKRLDEEAAKPQTYKWPSRTLPDGSIADY
jgi:galactonate dehydratase